MNKERSKYLVGLAMAAVFVLTFSLLVRTYTQVRMPSKIHPVEFYANHLRDDLRLTFKEAMLGAQESIDLVIYTLSDTQLIQVLRKKAEEGVRVTVLCDAAASKGCLKKLRGKVKVVPRKPKGIMHMKVLVIDGLKTWIGSSNMTIESLRFHGNFVAGFYHSELARLFQEKAYAMDKHIPSRTFQTPLQKVECWFLPDKKAVDRIQQMINAAEKSIKVAMFTWTRRDFAESLISAKERGVDVKVYLDRYSGKGASRHIVDMLCEAGIPVALSEGSALLHYKLMQIDGKKLVNGSANWTKAAFTSNDDTFFILDELTPTQKKMIDRLWDVIQEESAYSLPNAA